MAITEIIGFTHDTDTGSMREFVIGKDGVKRWPDNGDPVGKVDIPEELRKMSEHMEDVAVKMDYYGGFNSEMKEKAVELLNASRMAAEWADCIEFEEEE